MFRRFSRNLERNFEIIKAVNSVRCENTPVVLFYPWYNAPPNAVKKYTTFYETQGWDVMIIRTGITQFLYPTECSKLCIQNYHKLIREFSSKQPIFIHAMSIGVYTYTHLRTTLLDTDEEELQTFLDRIFGQVFDSFVYGGFDYMMKGAASEITSSPFYQSILHYIGVQYLRLNQSTADNLDRDVNHFMEHIPRPSPTLFFFCYNDPLCNPNLVDDLMKKFQAEHPENFYRAQSWKTSGHCRHLQHHPDEYVSTLTGFIEFVKEQRLQSQK